MSRTTQQFVQWRPTWEVVTLACLAVAIRLAVGADPIDDAFITFRYSQNLAELGSFVYNTGEHVLGTTTPLFTILLAIAAKLGASPIVTAFVISLAADFVAVLAAAELADTAGGRTAAAVAAAWIAFWPALLISSASGLETSLYVGLILSTIVAVRRQADRATGVLAGLTLLCRPSALLLVGAILIWIWRRRSPWPIVVPIVAVCLPWILWATWYFGHPIPQSVLSKAARHATQPPWLGLHALVRHYLDGPQVVVTALAFVGVVRLFRSGQSWVRPTYTWWALVCVAFSLTNAFAHYDWYFVPLMPPLLIAASLGAIAVSHLVIPGLREPRRLAGLVALVALVCLIRLPGRLERRAVEASSREHLYSEVAARMASADPTATIAATEIGAIGFYFRGRVLDLFGLVSQGVLGRPMLEVVLRDRPRWIVSEQRYLEASLLTAPEFAETYEERPGMGAVRIFERTAKGQARLGTLEQDAQDEP